MRTNYHNCFNRVLMVLLIISVLFLSGCSSNLKGTEKELYFGSWILHNPNDTTNNNLEINYLRSSVYNFLFNMPGSSPEYYSSIIFVIHPNQGIAAASHIYVATPLLQTLYAYVENQAREYYETNYSIYRSVYINTIKSEDDCLRFGFDVSSEEKISNDVWNSLNPELEETKDHSFGGSYSPGSISLKNITENNREYTMIYFKDNLINGINSFIEKSTSIGVSCCNGNGCREVHAELESPNYLIYIYDVLYENHSFQWSETKEIMLPVIADKNFSMIVSVPNYYPIFNRTIIKSNFSTRNTDYIPPYIETLNISSSFIENQELLLSFNAYDNVLLSSVKAYYKNETSDWQEIILSGNNEKHNGTIFVIGNSLDLKLELIDSSNNVQSYEIYPVSLKMRDSLYIESSFNENQVITPNSIRNITGYLKDNYDNGVNNVLLNFYRDDQYLGSTISHRIKTETTSINGFFYYEFKIPINSSDQINFSVVSLKTGIYPALIKNYILNITRYEHDISITDSRLVFSPEVGEQNVLEITLSNNGRSTESFNLLVNHNEIIIENKSITLERNEILKQNVTLIPVAFYNNIDINANLDQDNYPSDNYYSFYFRVSPQYDASCNINYKEGYFVNLTNVSFSIYNSGLREINNINYSLYLSIGDCYYDDEDCEEIIVDKGFIERLDYRESRNIISSFVPESLGYMRLRLIINSSEDQYPENDVSKSFIEVLNSGPDPRIRFSYKNYDTTFLIDQPENIILELENIGNNVSENINVSLYEYFYNETKSQEIYELISSVLISQLGINEFIEINMSYTPIKLGYHNFYAEIVSEDDIRSSNNMDYYNLFAVKNETDLMINNLWMHNDYSSLDYYDKIFYVELLNLGLLAENVTVNLYDNDSFIANKILDYVSSGGRIGVSFEINDLIPGNHKFKAEVLVNNDTNLTNNVLEKEFYIPKTINVTFNIHDKNNNPVHKRLYFENFINSFPVNGTMTISIPNLTETNDNLWFYIIEAEGNNFFDESQFFSAISYEVILSSEFNITSLFLNKTQDNGMSYYFLSYNKFNNDVSSWNGFILSITPDKILDLGLKDDILENYDVYYCIDYNLSLMMCNSPWKEANLGYANYNPKTNITRINSYSNEAAEAFALSDYFFNGNTTDIKSISEDIISNLTFERVSYGKIIFLNETNISNLKNKYENLREYIKILLNKISIDTDSFPELKNSFANLMFRGVHYRNPQVLYNGLPCSDSVCKNKYFDSNAGTYSLTVTSFSTFEIVEGLYCGDSVCSSSISESCSNCIADCGTCPIPPDGGGGGGGGGGTARRRTSCEPDWQCQWGPCVNFEQNWICIDKNNCNNNTEKPAANKRNCLIPSECVDNDGDGYGVGKDCIGPDMDDNDLGITTVSRQNLNKKAVVEKVYIGIILLLSAIILILILIILIVVYKRKKIIQLFLSHFSNAKMRVNELRNYGYNDYEIRGMFKEKGWTDSVIDQLLR